MGEKAPCLINIGACYEELSGMWDKQAMKDWEPIQHQMHDYKGMTGGWQGILGLYENMKEKQKEILKTEGMEKEKDSAVARGNTLKIGVEAERAYFRQDMGIDMNRTCQVWLENYC